MTPLVDNYLDILERVSLKKGNHKSREAGMCAMEAAAYIAGEPHSDHPVCVSKTITAFLTNWNDSLSSDADRDRLIKPLLPMVVGTANGKATELKRSYMALDWLLRECAPAFLSLTPSLVIHADALRAHVPVTSAKLAKSVQPIASAAGDAAWAAVGDAVGDAAGAAAWAAVGDAAGAAARAAAGAAAWAAAWAAAATAERSVLKSAVESLQASAVLLVRRMCDAGKEN